MCSEFLRGETSQVRDAYGASNTQFAGEEMEKVCVVGLGYVGLPTAAMLATHGFHTIGVDIDREVVENVLSGDHISGDEELVVLVRRALREGHFEVTSEMPAADFFLIAVPTPVLDDKTPELNYVEAAASSIGAKLQSGNTVVVESTLPPGATGGTIRKILERSSGMTAGQDFHLAYCPERALPGAILREITQNDRVIGGIDRDSAEKAAQLYRRFVTGKLDLTDLTTAEVIKLAENAFRDAGVALTNQLSDICTHLGVNVWEVTKRANQHPRVHYLQPGPGVGGHCVPVDPWFLIHAAPEHSQLFKLCREVNDRRPHQVVAETLSLLRGVDGPRVALLGLAYKADIGDTRESPALAVMELLLSSGVTVCAYDPHVSNIEHQASSLEEAAEGAHAIIILTGHTVFKGLEPARIGRVMREKRVLDTQFSVDLTAWRAAGFEAVRMGEPRNRQTLQYSS